MKSWLLALIPAVLAGLFSIGPFVWDRVIAAKYSLDYSAKEIGKIERQGKRNIFYSVRLTNTGSDRLTNVDVKLQTKNVAIDTLTTSPELIDLDKTIADGQAHIKIPILHSQVKLEIAMLVVAAENYSIVPYITSDQTAGREGESDNRSRSLSEEIGFALASAGVVFAAGILFVMPRQRRRTAVLDPKYFVATELNFTPNAIAYIAASAGLEDVLKHTWNHATVVHYFGVADLIYCESKKASNQAPFLSAIKCFFLAPNLAGLERNAIEELVFNMTDSQSRAETKSELDSLTAEAAKTKDLWEFRKSVDRFLAS